MRKYEAMFIFKPDLPESERVALGQQVGDVITKNGGTIAQAAVWAEKRKFTFRLKHQDEGMYYLINFSAPSDAIAKLRSAYNINEAVLRYLITVRE